VLCWLRGARGETILFVRKWIQPVGDDRGALFPLDIGSWLPAGHLAWQITGVAGELDLAAFEAAYRADGQGQAPYDPKVMVTVVLYCHYKGIRSARKIAAACVDDLGCRVISGGVTPSHMAFARFRHRHRDAIRGLFVQVLGLLAAAGAVEGRSCAVDGSPASGNASRFANLTRDALETRITALQERIDQAAAAWLDGGGMPAPDALWDDGDGGDDDGPGGGGLPRPLARMTRTLGRLRAARAALDARQQAAAGPGTPHDRLARARQALAAAQDKLARAEARNAAAVTRYETVIAAGGRWGGSVPVPADRNVTTGRLRTAARKAAARLAAAEDVLAAQKICPSDPATRLMPAKNGGYLQGWNIQAAAVRRQILLALELHDSPVDVAALVPVIEAAAAGAAAAGLREQIRAWLADSGYACAASFTGLSHLMLLVAVRNEKTQTGRARGGRDLPAAWQPMAARLATPAGKALYKRRAALVEPAFAQLFTRFGRYLSYRGRDAADAELKLLGTVHNIAKLLQHRHRAA
jgi:transposase